MGGEEETVAVVLLRGDLDPSSIRNDGKVRGSNHMRELSIC